MRYTPPRGNCVLPRWDAKASVALERVYETSPLESIVRCCANLSYMSRVRRHLGHGTCPTYRQLETERKVNVLLKAKVSALTLVIGFHVTKEQLKLLKKVATFGGLGSYLRPGLRIR